MTNLYLIRNCGCDDTTLGLAYMTDEQLSFFKNVVENLNKNSTYGCMPTVEVYRIDKDMLSEAVDDDDPWDVLTVDDRKYAFKDYSTRYGNELERVI